MEPGRPVDHGGGAGSSSVVVDGQEIVDDDGGNECIICMSAPRDTTALPCRHMWVEGWVGAAPTFASLDALGTLRRIVSILRSCRRAFRG